MKIYVDADACPVKQEILQLAAKYMVIPVFVFSISHSGNHKLLEHDRNIELIMVDNESQAADMAIMNRVTEKDVVVTGDFGLASIALSKKAAVVSHNGSSFTEKNIDRLLYERHLSAAIRRSGGRVKGPAKRSKEENEAFKNNLECVILKKMKDI